MANFVQVPPQSTGRKVATTARTEIFFDQLTGTFSFGAIVTGASSGATGTITAVQTEGYPSGSGKLYLKDNSGVWLNNEFIEIGVTSIATCNFTSEIQTTLDVQKVVITDADNLERTQRIDRFGATVNTFTEGAPIFGPFNSLQVGELNTIKEYPFAYDEQPGDFYTEIAGGGASVYNSTRSLSVLSCTTTAGDLAKRTTHYYHPYSPGHGTIIMMSIQIGDVGKTNVRRRWGYYDDSNGMFFELDGTMLYVVVRSNTTGSVVDTRIPQTDWSEDACDGSDAIGFNLDVSRPNIYWIDFQWLGAGVVRYGVYEPSGSRIISHIERHTNIPGGILPYIKTASLPYRYEQENTGTSVSTSEMYVNCATVMHTSKVLRNGIKHSADSGIKTITAIGGEVPVLAFRPKLTVYGEPNHSVWKGISYTLANMTNTGGGPVVFRIKGGTEALLTGEVFVSYADNSIAEFDVTATGISALAPTLNTAFCLADSSFFAQDIAPKELHTFELFLNADDATQPCLIITAECLTGTSADIWVGVNWEEILA